MSESFADSMPWPGQSDSEDAASSETTPGGQKEVRWVTVAVNLDPGEAAVVKGRLDSENIPAIVQQEALGIVLGLTVGPMGSAKVLVPEPLAEQALEILAETFEIDDEEWDDEEWWDEAEEEDIDT
ncbi:MAG: DUF2007 domain-containing protein [Chloroflexota bacterium]